MIARTSVHQNDNLGMVALCGIVTSFEEGSTATLAQIVLSDPSVLGMSPFAGERLRRLVRVGCMCSMRRKRTAASSLLRRIMTKFTVVDTRRSASSWGPAFVGIDERPLTREEQRLREWAAQQR
jgi:hypothetical protein